MQMRSQTRVVLTWPQWLRHRSSLSHMVCDRPSECPAAVYTGKPSGEDIIVVPISFQNKPSNGVQIRAVASHERPRNVAREQPGTL